MANTVGFSSTTQMYFVEATIKGKFILAFAKYFALKYVRTELRNKNIRRSKPLLLRGSLAK